MSSCCVAWPGEFLVVLLKGFRVGGIIEHIDTDRPNLPGSTVTRTSEEHLVGIVSTVTKLATSHMKIIFLIVNVNNKFLNVEFS